jgi:hypothetical protein
MTTVNDFRILTDSKNPNPKEHRSFVSLRDETKSKMTFLKPEKNRVIHTLSKDSVYKPEVCCWVSCHHLVTRFEKLTQRFSV